MFLDSACSARFSVQICWLVIFIYSSKITISLLWFLLIFWDYLHSVLHWFWICPASFILKIINICPYCMSWYLKSNSEHVPVLVFLLVSNLKIHLLWHMLWWICHKFIWLHLLSLTLLLIIRRICLCIWNSGIYEEGNVGCGRGCGPDIHRSQYWGEHSTWKLVLKHIYGLGGGSIQSRTFIWYAQHIHVSVRLCAGNIMFCYSGLHPE